VPAGDEISAEENLLRIRLIAPTTSRERMTAIATSARGFIYYVSREGVTGVRNSIAQSLEEKIALIRNHTQLPIAVGFGISTPEQAAQIARMADAVVVGSAIVDLIGKGKDGHDLADRVGEFVRPMAAAVHRSRES
jgi:tryptophan synthase alpha chain